MSLFLAQTDLIQLTGYARKAKQCAQLSIMNIPYRTNVRGEPLVTIAYINGLKAEPIKTGWQSNLMAA